MPNLPVIQNVPVGENLTLQSWQTDSGEIIVGLRWACEQIGVAWTGQLQKVRENPLFSDSLVREDIVTGGRKRGILGLPLDLFLMFLATINAASVHERAREPLLTYQRQSAQALRDFWTTGVAINPGNAISIFDQMRYNIDLLEAHDKQIQQIEQRLDRSDIAHRADWLDDYDYLRKIGRRGMDKWNRSTLRALAEESAQKIGITSVPIPKRAGFGEKYREWIVDGYPMSIWDEAMTTYDKKYPRMIGQ